MVAELTIGRVGFAVDLDGPEQFSHEGSPDGIGLTLSGSFAAVDLATTLYLRDQLTAHAELGELVAVTWTEDASFAGYYSIKSVNVSTPSLVDRGYVTFAIGLTRRGQGGRRGMQSQITEGLRANAHSLTTSSVVPRWATQNNGGIVRFDPDILDDLGQVPPGIGQTYYAHRSGRNGDSSDYDASFDTAAPLKLWGGLTLASGSGLSANPVATVDPDGYYNGGCEVYFDGKQMVGIDTPQTVAGIIVGPATTLHLSNGIVRAEIPMRTATQVAAFKTTLNSQRNRDQWDSETTWSLSHDIGSGWVASPGFEAFEILRNDPESAAIRLVTITPSTGKLTTVDLIVRRGMPWFELVVTPIAIGTFATRKLRIVSNEAGSAAGITGGMQRSTADGDSNKWVAGGSGTASIGSATQTLDTTNGGIEWAFGTALKHTVDMCIGYVADHPIVALTADEIMKTYHAPIAEKVTAEGVVT